MKSNISPSNYDECELYEYAGNRNKNDEGDVGIAALQMPRGVTDLYNFSLEPESFVEDFDRNQFLENFAHLFRGIVAFQQKGFIHNDIKTSNIIVNADTSMRFIDFGISKFDSREWEDRSRIFYVYSPCIRILLNKSTHKFFNDEFAKSDLILRNGPTKLERE